MPLLGGGAGKIGDRYEIRWAVACALVVLDEHALSIRLEPPGHLGDGIEFFLRTNDGLEFHQSKRQQTGQGGWTINQLAREGVLSGFRQQLQASPEATCVFVSSHPAVNLHELAERASSAQSAQEFEREFVSSNQTLGAAFCELRRAWGDCSAEDAYSWLKRVRVRMLDEQGVQELVRARLSPLVGGNVDDVASRLFELMFDSVHQELTAADIWRHLEAAGYRRCNWANDPHVLAAVTSITDRYLQRLRRELISGSSIPRGEAHEAADSLMNSGQRATMVVGPAGQGKSAVLLQTVEALRQRGLLVLALRLDELQPVLTPSDLGRQLGLPGSPAAVLAAVSRGSPALLVIDQLDAVSLVSGRNVQFFGCIDDLIADTQHVGLRLLMACRKFDVDNDHRIRRLVEAKDGAAELPVAPLSREAVESVLDTLRVPASTLTSGQLNLLSVPLHLRLFAQVAAASRPEALDFRTVNDLYDLFWRYKQTVIEQVHLGRSVRWTEVIDALCRYMSEHQVLSAPTHVVDNWRIDAQAMISEHVLYEDGGRIGFFHEGFFDYAFARRFAARNEALLDFLMGDEQHLFRRAQVRQILAFERPWGVERYLSDAKDLLLSSRVRFHVKHVVLSLLHSLTDPTREEWGILGQLMKTEPKGPLGMEAWRTIDGSTAWFDLIDSLDVVAAWLAGPDEGDADRAMRLLLSVQEQRPDRVGELLDPFVGAGEKWDRRVLWLMQWCDVARSERFFLLFMKLLDSGVLDAARGPIAMNSDFWSLIDRCARREPARASKAIGHYLLRRLAMSLQAGRDNPFGSTSGAIANSVHESTVFQAAASGAPLEFVTEVFPFLLQVLRLGAVRQGEPPWADRVWGLHGFQYGIENRLLIAVRQALAAVASGDPSAFREFAAQLRRPDLETADYLLFGAYAANPRAFADEAAEYLVERPARLDASHLGQSHWEARRLLEAITPHCSQDALARLEDTILGYYPTWERTREAHRDRGRAQLILLGGIDAARLSPTGVKRIQEWERKFQGKAPRPPQAPEVIAVPSPISNSAAEKMTDQQWLKAIERYKGEYAHEKGFPYVGGASELANVLEGVARRQPERFAQLLCRLPDATHPAYFNAILRGMKDAQVETDVVLEIVERCSALPERPCGDSICMLIARVADRQLPAELLDTVVWHAVEDRDPRPGEWKVRMADDEDPRHPSPVFANGINTVRVAAARVMGHLIFADRSRGAYFLPALQRMVRDPSVAVRSCVATTLLAMLTVDRDTAVKLFMELCDCDEDLLGTTDVYEFLRYASTTHLAEVLDTIRRMTSSGKTRIARMGSQLACLAALDQEDAAELSRVCLSGPEPQREGAAAVLAANLSSARFRRLCEEGLAALFDDESEKVRSEAADCFRQFKDTELSEVSDLISKYVPSRAFGSMGDSLIHALKMTTARMPAEICLTCERFLDVAGPAVGDISTHAAAEAHTITALLLRAYHQADTPELQSRSLDLIDRMIQLRALGFDEALASMDR